MNDNLFTDEPAPDTNENLFTDEAMPPYDPQGVEKEKYGPGLQDATVSDALTAQGVAGLGKLGVGAMARGVGAALDAIPATENIAPTIERIANNQTLKSMGGTMGQLKQMEEGRGGRDVLDRAAEFAREKGLSDVFSTGIGREKALQGLMKQSGETVGNLRKEAGAAPSDIVNKIVENPKMNKYLGEGSASRELPGVDMALKDIKEIGGTQPTHASLANAATYINENAAGNKLYQPVNAETDVANILSRENNAGIAQSLGSDKAKQYVDALSEQEKLHPLEHLQQRGELRSAGGRGGLGTRIVQEVADRFGYRLTAKAAAAIHDALTSAPDIGKGIASAAKVAPAGINEAISQYLLNERRGQ